MHAKSYYIVIGLPKPRIRRTVTGRPYVCNVRNNINFGYGNTPREAYNSWVEECKKDHVVKLVMRIVK